ncbi:putative RNA helicase [Coniosporium tulheliwenetii]|uniref:RNA helicase n=1 Tax=Coniosporium tulheliwenetii TaxID=3383036 RepID=A0ACC2YPG1_9PEZI|nr:putative RNA helicase [Cladosporium sp. JES 115]
MSVSSRSVSPPGPDSDVDASDSSSHIKVFRDGSRKRRRLSPSLEDQIHPQSSLPTSSLSRIKAKKTGLLLKDSGEPDSVQAVVQGKSSMSFATLGVDPWLVASLSALRIKHPTGIQKAAIPQIMQGRDCIGGSRTGSGKTVAFAVPILQAWAEDPRGIFAVVLTPTRELALQIHEQFKAISAPQSLKSILITGGGDMRAQAIALSQRPHVVIATPGRLADHINTSGEDTICGLRRTRFVVLDEADRLLAPSEKGTTMTDQVLALKDLPTPPGRPPVFVCEVDTEVLAIPPTLQQKYLQAPVTQRESFLHVLLLTPANLSKSIIIFCNRTSTATLLEYMLRLLEHRVTALHSKLPQRDRIANLARFRAKAARILVATDVAARGLDIPEVELVINYDVPRDPDDYIHRVGRTARAGRKGESVTFVGQRDVELVLAIEERVGKKMVEYEEPDVNLETRVIRDGLKVVGEKKREALLQIEEGRDVVGNRKKGMVKRAKR